ncbi:MAG: glutamine amidotransferase [Planctomycetia bacterium]|nr:glutamine amidotransferase [Planctomycetia bacterium]
MGLLEKVCYLGDDSIDRAAIYLAGIMTHYGIDFDHIDSDKSPSDHFTDQNYSLYIISDYPSKMFRNGQMEHIAQSVEKEGSGLLMLGGWESFHGRLGEYQDSPLVPVLPVQMLNSDDRRNFSLPLIVRPSKQHPILGDLPWQNPSAVGGINEFCAKKGAQIILEGIAFDIRILDENVVDCSESNFCNIDGNAVVDQVTIPTAFGDSFAVRPVRRYPLLVVDKYGSGRTAAFASDVAPHWVGGFVDWGKKRLFQNVGDGFIEVGEDYAQFFRNLILWTGKLGI